MRSTRHARVMIALLIAAAPATFGAVPSQRYDFLADSLYAAGAHDSARAFATRSVARALASGDSVALGRSLVYLGRARLMLHEPGAPALFARAGRVSRAAGDSLGWAMALGFQALTHSIAGRFDDAIALSERRIEIARAIDAPGNVGWGHILIGYACLNQGRLERAETEYRQAVEVLERAGRPRDALEALIGLGRVHHSAGRVGEARAAYREALGVARDLGDHRQEADCWNNLGGLELDRGDLSLAVDDFRRAYDLKREVGAYDAASPATNMALANTIIGRYAAAESSLVDAIADARRWRFQIFYSEIYATLGRLRLSQERPRGAAVYFRRAIALGDTGSVSTRLDAVAGLAEALLAQDSTTAALAVFGRNAPDLESSPPSPGRGAALLVCARCERVAGRTTRADALARAALDDAAARDDVADQVLAALELCAVARAADRPADAFAWFDRARMTYAESSGRSGEYQWREAFRASLAPRLIEGAAVTLAWPPDRPRAERERALFDVLQEIRARTLMERVNDPRGVERGGVAAMVTARQLQSEVLRPGECLLDVSTGPTTTFVFALTRDSLRLSVIDDGSGGLARRARRYTRLAGTPGDMAPPPEAVPSELFRGVQDVLSAASALVVVCDGWISSLPLAAFVAGGGEPLIDNCTVSAVPAASLLADLRARAAGAPLRGALAFAPAGTSLPGAQREVRSLAARYAGVTVVSEIPAGASLADLAGECGVVHVASHVHVNGERPWQSGIQMGDDSASADYLRASQIARSDFRGRLVVLSSCESALGRETQGEGVLGITTAFLAAGARAVVASLWKVDDRTTEDLMRRFYQGLEAGLDVGGALRAAQLEIRRKQPAPFYWAGFVVVGDATREVSLERRPQSRIRVVLLSLATLGVAAGAVLAYRRRCL